MNSRHGFIVWAPSTDVSLLAACSGPAAALLPLIDPGARDPGDPCAEPSPAARPAAGGAPQSRWNCGR